MLRVKNRQNSVPKLKDIQITLNAASEESTELSVRNTEHIPITLNAASEESTELSVRNTEDIHITLSGMGEDSIGFSCGEHWKRLPCLERDRKRKKKKKKKRGAFSVEHITLTAARGESTGLSGEEH